MSRPTRKSRCHSRARRTRKASSKPPNKTSKRPISLLLVVLEAILWMLLLVVSYAFPAAEGLAKNLQRLMQLLLGNLDDD